MIYFIEYMMVISLIQWSSVYDEILPYPYNVTEKTIYICIGGLLLNC